MSPLLVLVLLLLLVLLEILLLVLLVLELLLLEILLLVLLLPWESDDASGSPSATPPAPAPVAAVADVKVGLAVQIIFHPPSALTWRSLPAGALPRCRPLLFGNKVQLLRGRGGGKGYVPPSDVAGGQYASVSGNNSHAVARVINARPYIVAILSFRQ